MTIANLNNALPSNSGLRAMRGLHSHFVFDHGVSGLMLMLLPLLLQLLDFYLDFSQIRSTKQQEVADMPLKSCKGLVLQQDMASPFPG